MDRIKRFLKIDPSPLMVEKHPLETGMKFLTFRIKLSLVIMLVFSAKILSKGCCEVQEP